jgi:tetratricopeptide (TPR) repeat protein
LTDDEDIPGESGATSVTKREGLPSPRPPAPTASEKERPIERGTLVGRYIVVDKLGEGGMGIVYRAFDPELDRKVAIKVLQSRESSGSSGGEQERLVREAQALARLAHPNVVAVYDVGSLPGDQMFVAMELVDGMTLRAWFKAKPRTWREVVPVMLAAGAGLAAAHEVGLVHRDFKPENVLVGKDGRVRVMDFGLARLRPDDGSPPAPDSSELRISSKSPLSAEITLAGHVVGTPAYMAPEIYDGHAADARTDQFAFGVALFEGLYRTRPFDKQDLLPSRAAPPKPKLPDDARVPAALQRVVLRAIVIDPAQRFPSMKELLEELSIDPAARRRRAIVAVGAALAAGGLVTAGFAVSHSRRQDEPCTGAGDRLAGVWDPAIEQAVHASFVATKSKLAEPSYAALSGALDGYASQWTEAVTDACRATRVRGDQTEEVLTLRESCLDQRLEELRAFTQLLVHADAAIVERGDKMVFQLERLAKCSNVAALRAPGLPPEHLKPKIAELVKKLAGAKAQLITGNYLAALAGGKACVEAARQIEYEPLVGEALVVQGIALNATGNLQEAGAAFADAAWTGMRSKRDDVVATAANSAAVVAARTTGKPGESRIWLGLGDASVQRTGIDPAAELQRLLVQGFVELETGELLDAIATHEKAFAAAVRLYGPDGERVAIVEMNYAPALMRTGAYGKAAPHLEHALRLREKSLGPDHPDVAVLLSNLGLCYAHLRDFGKAHAVLDRALQLREKLYGPNNPLIAPTLDNVAQLRWREGDIAGALAAQEKATKLSRLAPGTSHPLYHELATNHAELLVAAGRAAEAHALYDELLDLLGKHKSSMLPLTLTSRAELALAERQWSVAASFADRAIAGYEAAGGKDDPGLWRPLTALARAKTATGDAAGARPLLERALAIGGKFSIVPQDLEPTQAALAKLGKP